MATKLQDNSTAIDNSTQINSLYDTAMGLQAKLNILPKPTINSTTQVPIGETPTTRLNIPSVNIPTANIGLGGAVDSYFSTEADKNAKSDALVAEARKVLSDKIPTATDTTTKTPSIYDQIKTYITKLGSKSQTESDLNKTYGVDDKEQAYIDASNEYLREKTDLQQRIESIRNRPGITKEQAAQQIDELTARGNANLANLAIISSVSQGNYQGALDIVKRKLDAEFEPLQSQADYLFKLAELNNNDPEVKAKAEAVQANIDALKNAKSDAYKTAVSNGATADVLSAIGSAQDPASVYQALGKYGTNETDVAYKKALIANALGKSDGGVSDGFVSSKVESDFRQDAVQLLDNVTAGALTIDDAYTKLRKLYSPKEVTDQAIKDILGMVTPIINEPTPTKTTETPKTKNAIIPEPNQITGGFDSFVNSLNDFLFSKSK